MKALVTTEDGGLGLRLTSVSEPKPRADQALVEVHAVSVNRGEFAAIRLRPPGSRLGWDVAGTVVAAAADGTGPEAGTRVVGIAVDGDGWGERVALSTGRLAPLPDVVSNSDAAALPVAGLTALYALQHAGWLLGRTVLITGAGGGVGRMAVQLAAAAGARVIAWVGSQKRAEGLEALGADLVTTYDGDDIGPVDVLLDSVGGSVLARAFQFVTSGGIVVCYGNTVRSELTLPNDWGFARPGLQLRYLYLLDEVTRRAVDRDLAFLVRLVAEGRFDPQVATVSSWTDPASVLRSFQERQLNGKAILTL